MKCQLQKLSRWVLIPLLCSGQREECWGFEAVSVMVSRVGMGGGRGGTHVYFLQRSTQTHFLSKACCTVLTHTELPRCSKGSKPASVERRRYVLLEGLRDTVKKHVQVARRAIFLTSQISAHSHRAAHSPAGHTVWLSGTTPLQCLGSLSAQSGRYRWSWHTGAPLCLVFSLTK